MKLTSVKCIVGEAERCGSFFRVSEWAHMLGLPLLGVLYAWSRFHVMFNGNVIFIFIISALCLAHEYSLNKIYDRHKSDVGCGMKRQILLSFLVMLCGIIIALFFSLHVVFLLLFATALGILYSMDPIRGKGIPGLDLLFNSLGAVILFLIGFTFFKLDIFPIFPYIIFIFLLFLPIQLVHEIEHYNKDKESKDHTTIVSLGINASGLLVIMSLVILVIWSGVMFFLYSYPLFLFFLTIGYVFAIFLAIRRKGDKESIGPGVKNLKITVRYITLLYGLGLILTFILWKI